MDSTDYSHEKGNDEEEELSRTEKTKKRNFLEVNGIIIDDFLASDNLNE